MTHSFYTACDLLRILGEENLSPAAYALKREAFLQGKDEEALLEEIRRRIAISEGALRKGLREGQNSFSGLTRGAARIMDRPGHTLIEDDFYRRAVSYALAVAEVNACGGKVISFPTAGSCGIVPGVLWAYRDSAKESPSEKEFTDAFIVASLIGVLIAGRATLAGAEGGCQAECGAAGAMAAAALVSFRESRFEVMLNAAALSLKNSLGLACDPVAGLVEVPCVKRNAFVAVQAVTAAYLSLNGVESAVPFDEVVGALREIGASLPSSIKESAEGGLAATPTGLLYKEKIR